MNDSGEFPDFESNYGGKISHVPSQPAVVPSPRSMPSRDRRMPFDTWNLTETQGNVLAIHVLCSVDSSQTSYHMILHSTTPKCNRCDSSEGLYRATCRER